MKIYLAVGVFIVFDIATGILKALFKGEINSSILRIGLFHKLAECFAVFGAGLLQYAVNYVDIGIDIPMLGAVTVYICAMETVSITENLCVVNPGLSKLFQPYLDKLK